MKHRDSFMKGSCTQNTGIPTNATFWQVNDIEGIKCTCGWFVFCIHMSFQSANLSMQFI